MNYVAVFFRKTDNVNRTEDPFTDDLPPCLN
jgi:hypothetical protein